MLKMLTRRGLAVAAATAMVTAAVVTGSATAGTAAPAASGSTDLGPVAVAPVPPPAVKADKAAVKADKQTSSLAAVYWHWYNYNSGKCLGIAGGNMANGTKAVQWSCLDHPDQFWLSTPLDDGNYYELRNQANSNKCLGVPGGTTASGAQLVIWDCNGHADQFWSPVRNASTGAYAFLNRNSGKIIGVGGGSLADGAPVVQWDWEGHADQLWY